MTRSPLLRLLLALLLGLGPLGATVLASTLHAPLCGCTGCAPSEASATGDASASCCDAASEPNDGPGLTAPSDCACALVAPERGASPALAPRTSASRDPARAELERVQRLVELASTPALGPMERADVPRARDGCHGPPGAASASGGARAAALGTLRI